MHIFRDTGTFDRTKGRTGRRTSRPFALLTVLYLLVACCNESIAVMGIRLAEVGPFSAVLAWRTDRPASFRIVYGEGTLFDRETVEAVQTTEHRLALTGLKPATRYAFRIEPGGPEGSFRSGPGEDGAFDLAVLDPASSACREEAPAAGADPDLIVLAGDCRGPLAGRRSSILTVETPVTGTRKLTFGRSLVLVAPDAATAQRAQIDPKEIGLRRILVLPALPSAVPESLEKSVILTPGGARGAGKIFTWDPAETARFEIDTFEIARVRSAHGMRHRQVIIEAPPDTKKTCLYCDRLLESGRYEESVAWYRRFIATNLDRHAVEDASYSLARILDEKLFRYEEAVRAYERFLETYPSSRQATLARYRLETITAHADEGFRALERFERARAGYVRSDPAAAAEAVESLLREMPEAAIVEDALLWLGNVLERVAPARARRHYRTLMERFPGSESAAIASIAVGDTFYRSKRYRLAVEAYGRASAVVPAEYRISVDDKLQKSRRNIGRQRIFYAAWAILIVWLAASAVLRARLDRRDLHITLIVLAAYGFAGGLLFTFAYDMARPLLPVLSVLAAMMGAVFLWNRALSRGPGRRAWVGILHVFTCSAAVLYLTMYWFHYLYLFGL